MMTNRVAVLLFTISAILMSLVIDDAVGESASEPTREQLQIQNAILQDEIKGLRRKVDEAEGEVYKAYLQGKIKEYQFQTMLMDTNISALNAQWWASHIILILVVFVVSSGILFSGYQLWKSVT